ncbi:hypothetical protein BHM03_00056779 [Ensete ventricosum]|uniref:Uncharacterized protein n=1 Tax=Ensete ventricosum TaxID=4639 RepID=A0A445MME7_ENSVE|nr:hypothetical protein BHM03_00056779 [Ensete ventricosum]
MSEAMSREAAALQIDESSETSQSASRGEDSIAGSAHAKGHASSSGVDSSMKVIRPVSVRDHCQTRVRVKDEPFQALFMVDMPEGELGAPLEPRWSGLMTESRVWSEGSYVTAYERGALYPALAKQLYGSTSKVLIEEATKSLIWVRAWLRSELEESECVHKELLGRVRGEQMMPHRVPVLAKGVMGEVSIDRGSTFGIVTRHDGSSNQDREGPH